jgi:hypothetical protein
MIFDGSVVDVASIVAAAAAPFVKPVRIMIRNRRGIPTPPFRHTRGTIIVDVLNGASLVPFVLLIGCVGSTDLLKTALETSRVFMGIGGMIGVVFVAAEIGRLTQ